MPRIPRRVAPQFPLYGSAPTDGSDKAPLDSPAFTGIPTVPDAPSNDASGQIASTNWVGNFVTAQLTIFLTAISADFTFSHISGTLADSQLVSSNVTQFQSALAIAWSQLTGTPTTLAGYGITNAVSNQGGSTIQASAATVIPIIVKGAASQTADLFEMQDSSGNIYFKIPALGTSSTRLKVGGGTTAVGASTPGIWLEVGGADADITRLFQVGNSNRPVANNEWNAFAIEMSASTNNNLLQMVGYGTDGNRKVLLTFKKSFGTNADIVQFNGQPQLSNTVSLTALNTGAGVVPILTFTSGNDLTVGPYVPAGGSSLDLCTGNSGDPIRFGIQNSAHVLSTEWGRIINGMLGMNGVTAPSQIIDIGSGKIVADGSLLTNLPPNALVAAPATSTSAGVAGQWAKDATNVYICVATNTWYKFTATATTF